jgi:hypothetical protein
MMSAADFCRLEEQGRIGARDRQFGAVQARPRLLDGGETHAVTRRPGPQHLGDRGAEFGGAGRDGQAIGFHDLGFLRGAVAAVEMMAPAWPMRRPLGAVSPAT